MGGNAVVQYLLYTSMFVGRAAPLWISTKDFSGVQKVIGHLQKDIERVTGVIPTIVNGDIQEKTAVIVGTTGHSPLIDKLISEGKVNAREISAKWDCHG
ncbi:hypothetical protein I876_15655 [Alteromonas mediterranea U7]|uniref:Uncharacterized protein n=1 Tax=Alteromonas mediterranea TaxID=314275 RepID=A0AAC9F7E3_9ALTE|nr:hypothetical protein I876_15655 [Alteromonas mediterranea U7]AGP94810.1 hypothetical protein I634_15575 [Alteromonas mediterranea U8]AMJ79675.1 hypothetical protein AV942_15940 [Alteromonas mediterranea]AMJ83833.1 hypothetical protein AV941_16025 [Alteromonas mediterranea]HBL19992.1 hypothetical protein [Alteromonas mediterranea]